MLVSALHVSGLQCRASLLRCLVEARALGQPYLGMRSRREPSFPGKQLCQVTGGFRWHRHNTRALPALVVSTCLAGPGLLCSWRGLPFWEQRGGESRRESQCLEGMGPFPGKALDPEAAVAPTSLPMAQNAFLLSGGGGMVTRPQSLLRGTSSRGRCSLHTTRIGSVAWSSSWKPPRSPVSLYRRRAGCSSVMGMLKLRWG